MDVEIQHLSFSQKPSLYIPSFDIAVAVDRYNFAEKGTIKNNYDEPDQSN
jgi:hypothetical protein